MAREAEATATLNAITTAACLVLTFTVQKLGLTLLDRELHVMKEKTLLKQVVQLLVSPRFSFQHDWHKSPASSQASHSLCVLGT